MATAVQKITLSSSRDIPFNKLVLSQSNVRHVKAGVSIDELAESIARRGLIQSLHVRPVLDAEGNEIDLSRLNNDGTVSEPADDEADEAPAAAEEAADQTAETEQAPAEEAKPAAKKRTSKKAEAADEQAPAEDEKPAPKKRTTKKAEADKAEPVE